MYAVGDIVLSKAGRDKNKFMVVVREEGEFLYLADGKVRKLSSPKKKRIKHIAGTSKNLDISLVRTDKQLRNVLSEFNI